MNDNEFAERPSGFMLGKEFIIVLVIIFSGLSFTLGYFVGKSGAPKPEPALQAIESSSQIRQQDVPPAPVPDQSQTGSALQQTDQLPVQEPVASIVPAAEKHSQLKSALPQNAKPGPEKSLGKVEPAMEVQGKKTVYTVQIGAFKNIADAKHLKSKFDKKGYRSFISEGKNNKAEKIFKVKTGEFGEKNGASVLALKIRKTEGLQTYVTRKTE